MATRKRSGGKRRRCTKRVRGGRKYTLIGDYQLSCKDIQDLTGMSNDEIRQMVDLLNDHRFNISDFDKPTKNFIQIIKSKHPNIMHGNTPFLKTIILTGCDIIETEFNPLHTRRSPSKSTRVRTRN
jgi:hypothetical protein